MQRRVGHNPNPVGINFMAFCVGNIHLSDHQNRYFSETTICDSLLRSLFSSYWLYILP